MKVLGFLKVVPPIIALTIGGGCEKDHSKMHPISVGYDLPDLEKMIPNGAGLHLYSNEDGRYGIVDHNGAYKFYEHRILQRDLSTNPLVSREEVELMSRIAKKAESIASNAKLKQQWLEPGRTITAPQLDGTVEGLRTALDTIIKNDKEAREQGK